MRVVGLGLVGVLLGGCSEVVRGGSRDGGADDAGDAPREAGRDVTLPPLDFCSAPGILGVNAAGVPFGRTTTALVDADRLPRGALPPSPRCPPPSAEAAHRVILRYTPPADGYLDVVLRASRSPFSERLSYATLRDGCAADAAELACTNSVSIIGLRPDVRVPAGRPVYVLAALESGRWNVDFRLSPARSAPGERCQDERSCVAGHTCVRGRCAANGGPFTFCRDAGAACDDGLTCMEAPAGSGRRRCARPFRLGERCDPAVGACAEGVCGGVGEARCVLPGTRSAPCRTVGAPCDAGLACAVDLCVEASTSGAVCSPSSLARLCPDGESCVAVDGGARCLRVGALGGACRSAGATRCDAGLRCLGGVSPRSVCAPVQGEGRACSPARPSDCDPSTECLPSPDGGGRCVRRGLAGTACGLSGPGDCDPGLACGPQGDGTSRCGPPQEAGARCIDDSGCEAGTRCARASLTDPSQRCVRDGATFGWCRTTGAPCDAGLACDIEARCLPRVAEGQACNTSIQSCGPGFRCDGTCRRDGAPGGYCRHGADPCDAGSVCREDSLLFEVCARVFAVGEVCGVEGVTGECAAGSDCVEGADRVHRCLRRGPRGSVCEPVERGGAPCDEGLACSTELRCDTPLRVGDACGASGAAPCGAGLTCSFAAAPARCVADGSFGARCRTTGAPCDADLSCVEDVFGGEARCVRRSPAGAACDRELRRCAADTTCVDGACVADGAAGRRCRASENPCDGGLRCVLGTCYPTVATGCSPRGPACVAPAECLWDGSVYACTPPPYAVDVRRAVEVEDPCLLDGVLLTTPLRFRVFGGDYEVTAEGTGGPHLVDPTGSLALLPYGLAQPPSVEGCAVVVGAAPTRRLLLGGGAWATHLDPRMYRTGNAVTILYEGSNVIEYRYTRPQPPTSDVPLPTWGAPSLQRSTGGALFRVTAPYLALTEGLSVRFTPR